jgi:hypothetical protein
MELEDPQDLRAGFRKYLRPTNERKQMSNKTIFKRIALVAVVALSTGVLSSVPAIATNNGATGAANAAAAEHVLNVATRLDAGSVVNTTEASNRSVGLLNNSTTLTTASLTSTATMLSSGELVFYTIGAADKSVSLVASGGTFTKSAVTGTLASTADKTQVSVVHFNAASAVAVAFKPNSGVKVGTVELYQNSSLTDPEDAAGSLTAASAINAGSVSKGTLIGKYTITVADTNTVGVYSAADSLCNLATSTSSAAASTDSAGAGVIANGLNGFIDINLRDAFEGALTGAVIIEASGGAGLAYNGDYTATTATADFNLVQVSTDANGKIDVARPAALANKSFTTSVTIKFNGVTACTKTIRFQGEVAKITASDPVIARTGEANTEAFRVAYEDDKGFPLYPQSGTTLVSGVANTFITSVDANATPPNSTTGAKAYGTVTCSSSFAAGSYLGDGSANLQLQYINTGSGNVVKSNIWKQSCAGDAYTYSASLDKVTPTPSSSVVLTISFKTAAGNPANAYNAVSGSTTSLLSVTGLGTAVSAPTATDKADTADGVKRYTYIVSATEGDNTAVVSVPVVNSANSAQSNVTLTYTIKSSSTTVTNAEVLKSIVSLIASINKQIQALQKLILRR